MGSGLITCDKCDRLYADNHSRCPHCRGTGSTNDPAAQAVGGVVAGGMMMLMLLLIGAPAFFVLRSCSEADAEAQALRDQAAVQEEANDHAEAKRLGMTFEDYRSARWASGHAHATCKVAAEGKARYDYKADWIPSFTWTVKDKVISVVGHDLRMQNGFGVFGPVTYFCDYSMVSDRVTSVLINQD